MSQDHTRGMQICVKADRKDAVSAGSCHDERYEVSEASHQSSSIIKVKETWQRSLFGL
jgi:hypothetical protein